MLPFLESFRTSWYDEESTSDLKKERIICEEAIPEPRLQRMRESRGNSTTAYCRACAGACGEGTTTTAAALAVTRTAMAPTQREPVMRATMVMAANTFATRFLRRIFPFSFFIFLLLPGRLMIINKSVLMGTIFESTMLIIIMLTVFRT